MSTTVPESDVGALEFPVKGSFRGLHDVSLVARQVGFEQLSFWLNPIGALMTIAFSVVFLILLGATAGTTTRGTTHVTGISTGRRCTRAF